MGIREYVDYSACFVYSILIILVAIAMKKDREFRTSFWIFFISGGICGIFCVLSYNINWAWNVPTTVLKRAISSITALAHTLAKFYVVLGRYVVLSSGNLLDNDWSRKTIIMLLITQMVIPCIVVTPFAFAQPTGVRNGYGPAYLTSIVQLTSAVLYGGYVVVGFILTFLAMRKVRSMMSMAKRSQESRKRSLARHELSITVYSSVLFLSHTLKCAQQVLFFVFANTDVIDEILLPYPYINDLAVFASPITILCLSTKLRRRIISFIRPSTHPTQPIAIWSTTTKV